MRYGVTFLLLASLLVASALLHGGWYWWGLWPAASFSVVAVAYLGAGPLVFGKRADGRLNPWATAALGPYLALSWSVWHAFRILSSERCCDEVAPGIYLGRRPCAGEIPGHVTFVLDLTAEFAANSRAIADRSYLAVPMLDAHTGNHEALRNAIQTAADWPGPIYIHCAQGHGRSACVAAAILVRRGIAADAAEAVRLLESARTGVSLSRSQIQLCIDLCQCDETADRRNP